MSFKINWPKFSDGLIESLKEYLEQALNSFPKKSTQPSSYEPVPGPIFVKDIYLGESPPELELLEIGEIGLVKSSFVFKVKYDGSARILLETNVQVNPLVDGFVRRSPLTPHGTMVAAHAPLSLPLKVSLYDLKLNGIVSITFDRSVGPFIAFRTDPLQHLTVSSSLDHVSKVRESLQSEIEAQIRKFILEDSPSLVNQWYVKSQTDSNAIHISDLNIRQFNEMGEKLKSGTFSHSTNDLISNSDTTSPSPSMILKKHHSVYGLSGAKSNQFPSDNHPSLSKERSHSKRLSKRPTVPGKVSAALINRKEATVDVHNDQQLVSKGIENSSSKFTFSKMKETKNVAVMTESLYSEGVSDDKDNRARVYRLNFESRMSTPNLSSLQESESAYASGFKTSLPTAGSLYNSPVTRYAASSYRSKLFSSRNLDHSISADEKANSDTRLSRSTSLPNRLNKEASSQLSLEAMATSKPLFNEVTLNSAEYPKKSAPLLNSSNGPSKIKTLWRSSFTLSPLQLSGFRSNGSEIQRSVILRSSNITRSGSNSVHRMAYQESKEDEVD